MPESHRGAECCACFPIVGGMQIATFFHLMWAVSAIGYAIGLLVMFGPDSFDDARLTAFTVINFLI